MLFTKNAREAERRDGNPQGVDELKYAIVPLDSFPEELKKLEGHAQYIAKSAAYIENHLADFRKQFAIERDG